MQGVRNESIVGKEIQYVCLPYRPYKEAFEEEHKKGICKIMEFLSHEENYPIYFHCMGGADRTGTIAFFLRALVDESDDDIHTDYELTALCSYASGVAEGAVGARSRNKPYYVDFLKMLNNYAPGQMFSVQVKKFLLSCGVSEETISKIINIIKI